MNIFDFYFPEWVFVAINLAILVFALSKLLFSPVSKILTERQNRVSKANEQIAAAQAEEDDMSRRKEEFTSELERQTLEQMKDARTRAGREYDRIIVEAEEKARAILNVSTLQAERERDAMRNSLRTEVTADALEAAKAFLSESMTAGDNEQLVNRFLSKPGISV